MGFEVSKTVSYPKGQLYSSQSDKRKENQASKQQQSATALNCRNVSPKHYTSPKTIMLISLTVGKVDAGVAVLLTQDKRLVRFPQAKQCCLFNIVF